MGAQAESSALFAVYAAALLANQRAKATRTGTIPVRVVPSRSAAPSE